MGKTLEFFKKIIDGEKPVIKHVTINPESVKENTIIESQQKQIAELQAIITRNVSEKAEERESEEDLREEEVVKYNLNEQDIEIHKKILGKAFSMRTFWAIYFGISDDKFKNPNTNLSKKLKYITFDEADTIAPFHDILLSNNSIYLTTENNKIIHRAESLKNLFMSVNALPKQVENGNIRICLDKEGNFVENVLMTEVSSYTYDSEGGLKYKPACTKPLYKMLQEKDSVISDLSDRLEMEQETTIGLQEKLNDLILSNKSLQASCEIANNEKSKMVAGSIEVNKTFMNMQKDLTRMQLLSIIDQDHIIKLEEQVSILRKEAERQGSTTGFNDAISKISNIVALMTSRDVPKESLEVKD
jgi:hypothetical protein